VLLSKEFAHLISKTLADELPLGTIIVTSSNRGASVIA